jgi:integrase
MAKRAKGEGSLFKQWRWLSTTDAKTKEKKKKEGKSGDYFIWIGQFIGKDGNRKRVNGKRGESQAAVKEKLEKAMEEDALAPIVSTTTVKEVALNWLKSKRDIQNETRSIYLQTINDYIIRFIGDKPIQEATKEVIETLFDTLIANGYKRKNKGLSPWMMKKIRNNLAAIFDYAIEEKIINNNFIKKIKIPKIEKTKINPLTPKELTAIKTATSKNRLYTIFLLDVKTGLRKGELLGLRWQDIDFESGLASIKQQLVARDKEVKFKSTLKTDGSFRTIGLSNDMLRQLKKFKKLIDKEKSQCEDYKNYDLVACHEDGNYIHPRKFQTIIDNIFKEAGVEKRRIHDLRHTFATLLLSDGAYINDVQEFLGHTDARTTLGIYGHVLPGRQRDLANKMDKILR